MKNSIKKISVSLLASTIILGSVASASAAPYKTQFTYRTYLTFNFKNICKPVVTKPKPPTNNNTTPDQNNQVENEQKPSTDIVVQPDIEVVPEQKPNLEDIQKPVEKPAKDNPTSYIESEVLRLVNIERSKAGLSALKLSSELSNVARMKSQDMADKNYFSHTSPTYGSPFDMMKQFGIKYTAAGENIAKGHTSAEAVMKGWMNSQGHKDNILSSKFGTLGVGYVVKGGTAYWTQMFTN